MANNSTTGIRIEVPQDIYKGLQEIQEEKRKKTGKKTSFSSIILEFCTEKLGSVQNEQNSEQFQTANVHPKTTTKSDSDFMLMSIEKRYRLWHETLEKWEIGLKEREKEFREDEKYLVKEKMEILEMKSQLLDEKEVQRDDSLGGSRLRIDNKLLEFHLQQKDERISQLEGDNAFLKRSLTAGIKAKSNEVIEKPEPKSFMDKIKEYSPWIIGGVGIIGAYLMANKKEKPAQLPKEVNSLLGILDDLPVKTRKELGEKLLNLTQVKAQPDKEKIIPKLNIEKKEVEVKISEPKLNPDFIL